MKRVLVLVLLLYLIMVAVDVTAASPQVQPVTPRWAALVAERVINDVRWAIQWLVEWRNTWLGEVQSNTQAQPSQPAATELLERMILDRVEGQPVPHPLQR